MSRLKQFNQVGDTIVEVLFALAVIGMVLGLAYGIATKSLMATSRNQERAEAVKFTETQIERIKAKAGDSYNFPEGRIFCLDRTLAVKNIGTISTLPTVADPRFPLYEDSATNCHVDANDQPTFYHYAIDYDRQPTGSINQDVFTVLTRWERAGGGGYDEITMYYKVHRP